jgi:hypothetical protein
MRNPKVLLLLIVFLGALPLILPLFDVRPSLLLGTSFFILNALVCLLGAATRYRFWWLTYGVGCVFSFVLFGMSSPLSLAVLLLTTFKA